MRSKTSINPKHQQKNITVSVIIGDGQDGGYLIFLEQKLKGANTTAVIGKANSILGKRTIVSVTVNDVLDETNWTSATVIVKEGEEETMYGPYSKYVDKNLDTVCFLIKIYNTNEI